MPLETLADGLFVQVVITAPQAELLAYTLNEAAEKHYDKDNYSAVRTIAGLAQFFDAVAANPRAFPVTGRYATSIKTRRRMMRRFGV